jgi:CubicO group peptidase (beta-lactamase class C family)
MLTLQLVAEGKWQLDEPLARDCVDPDIAADPRHLELTTRHVFSHTTGFRTMVVS